jgi:2-oxoglutarate ferredoxin oxidoreductase subunit beta
MHAHKGAAFVEILQNCNVFNDGAFDGILKRDARPNMLIELHDGEPIRFGSDGQYGVAVNEFGEPRIVEVADVGEAGLLVHDEHRADPTLAFALSRLSTGPHMPTPVGVFRDIERPVYEAEVQQQLAAAVERSGPGDLAKVLAGGATWTVS